jgi:esterase/lipase superfamily enzyme
MLAAGASIGAFLSAAAVCRHPDLFKAALCMSGSFDLTRFLHGEHSEEMHHASPLHFLPQMPEDSPVLARLRQRFVLLAYGSGRWENADQNWQFAGVLGDRGIPNRVDIWGPEWDHDWPTWRHMLPQYLDELLRR